MCECPDIESALGVGFHGSHHGSMDHTTVVRRRHRYILVCTITLVMICGFLSNLIFGCDQAGKENWLDNKKSKWLPAAILKTNWTLKKSCFSVLGPKRTFV